MKQKMRILGIGLLTVTLAGFGLYLAACSGSTEETTQENMVPVQAIIVEPSDQYLARQYTGSLEGEKQAVLRARLAESVEEVKVKEGQEVAEGDVLLTLDRYGPSSNYLQTKSVYTNAEKNYNKMKFLFEQGAISESQYDAARTDYEVAKAQFDAVSRMVELHSPITGSVTEILVSPGEFVSVGQELATVATTDRFRVKFNVNADQVGFFHVDDEVLISHQTVPDKMTGRIVTIATSADPTTRSFQVEALVDKPDHRFRPGMFVQIEYVLQRLDAVLAVPQKAVMVLNDQPTLYVVEDGRAIKREVQVGADLIGKVVVTSGLQPGDTLVTIGQDYLTDSARVNLTAVNGNHQ